MANPSQVTSTKRNLVSFGILVALLFIGYLIGSARTAKAPSTSRLTHLTAGVIFSNQSFSVSNRDQFDWHNCDFDLNDDYRLKAPIVRANEVLHVSARNFAKRDGERFNPVRFKPQQFFIYCRDTPHGTLSFLVGWR